MDFGWELSLPLTMSQRLWVPNYLETEGELHSVALKLSGALVN